MNRAIDEILKNPLPDAPRRLTFSVLRIPFFLEPGYDESKPFIETNRERLIKKWVCLAIASLYSGKINHVLHEISNHTLAMYFLDQIDNRVARKLGAVIHK